MKNIKLIAIIVGVVLAVILAIVFGVNGVQNGAIGLEEQVNSAKSSIETQEKRRVDLIYNLVDTVREYSKHEYETLKAVVDGRGGVKATDADIKEVRTMINATVESYPQLKADVAYKELMNELSTTENLIQQARDNYNRQVKSYKNYVRTFPNKQFLNMTGYETLAFEYLEYNAPSDAPRIKDIK